MPDLLPPIPITMIGTGTGDGGTSKDLPTGTIAQTPGNYQPNVVVRVIGPIVAIVVRALNLFLVTLTGLVTAAMTPAGSKVLYPADFYHMVLTCASLAVVPVALGALKDLVTVFAKLEGKFPLLTGSV